MGYAEISEFGVVYEWENNIPSGTFFYSFADSAEQAVERAQTLNDGLKSKILTYRPVKITIENLG